MKKDDKRSQDNIVPFPGLGKRLYEKGLELMEMAEFGQASDLLRQAASYSPADPGVAVAYLVSLYEYRDYEEAKRVAEGLLREGIGEYYEIIDIYLMILIQSGEHKKVIHTIETLFEERQVPPEKYEHLSSLLQLSKKVVKNGGRTEPDRDGAVLEIKGRSLPEQALIIGSLLERNIRPYMRELLRLLASSESHPFIQTIALNVLKEHGTETPVKVEKLSRSGEFIPAELPDVQGTPAQKAVLALLEKELADENPILLSQLESMIARHFFLLYPFGPEEKETPLWAAAYFAIGMELYGERWDPAGLEKELSAEPGQILEMAAYLRSLEEISSPNA